jgi:hypothetical protein
MTKKKPFTILYIGELFFPPFAPSFPRPNGTLLSRYYRALIAPFLAVAAPTHPPSNLHPTFCCVIFIVSKRFSHSEPAILRPGQKLTSCVDSHVTSILTSCHPSPPQTLHLRLLVVIYCSAFSDGGALTDGGAFTPALALASA